MDAKFYIKNLNKSSNNDNSEIRDLIRAEILSVIEDSVPKTRILEVTSTTERDVTIEEFLSLITLDGKPITEEEYKSLDLADGPILLHRGNQTMNCIAIEKIINEGVYNSYMLFGGYSNSEEIGYGEMYKLYFEKDACYINYYEV